jgi:hypothetical protein
MRANRLEKGRSRVQIGIEEWQRLNEEVVANISVDGKRMYRLDS